MKSEHQEDSGKSFKLPVEIDWSVQMKFEAAKLARPSMRHLEPVQVIELLGVRVYS
jgi:hypothetical protein